MEAVWMWNQTTQVVLCLKMAQNGDISTGLTEDGGIEKGRLRWVKDDTLRENERNIKE